MYVLTNETIVPAYLSSEAAHLSLQDAWKDGVLGLAIWSDRHTKVAKVLRFQ